MNGWPALGRFLRTDPRDVGCAQAMEMLHAYAELVAAGEPAEERYRHRGAPARVRAVRRGFCRDAGRAPRRARLTSSPHDSEPRGT